MGYRHIFAVTCVKPNNYRHLTLFRTAKDPVSDFVRTNRSDRPKNMPQESVAPLFPTFATATRSMHHIHDGQLRLVHSGLHVPLHFSQRPEPPVIVD
jgi:hypothetical protein